MFQKPNNPWIFAAGIAVGCMLLDDLPESGYNTFHDPGAAAMLSIIFADATIIAIRRGSKKFVAKAFLPVLIIKFIIQHFFWVKNADVLDIGTLLAAHTVLALFAIPHVSLLIKIQSAICAFGSVLVVIMAIVLFSGNNQSWLVFYFQLGAARILIPLAFWFAVHLVEKQHLADKL